MQGGHIERISINTAKTECTDYFGVQMYGFHAKAVVLFIFNFRCYNF